MRFIFFLILLATVTQTVVAQNFDIVTPAGIASIVYDPDGKKLDSIAAHLLAADIEAVTNVRPIVTKEIDLVRGNVIIIGSFNSRLVHSLKDSYFDQLNGKWECFSHRVITAPFKNIAKALVIAGSDARGTAYGVFALSEKIGVSPWWWWADVPVKKQPQLMIQQRDFISEPPSVKYRGIFINDEDWGLQPWAAKTFEPETGDIGPKTYAKVFELLLRLKANLIWPAMHESTKAFFHYPGNPKVAEDYQIVVGSSHAEPMLRNNVGEWDVKTRGRFNYLTNRESILNYWEERVKESRDVHAIYSLGIRGVHDSQMEGVKDLKEAVPVVAQVIRDERDLLAKYINQDVTAVPQVLTPYKEVLEIYDNGLKVPDDVTLVWPDDNYGYIQRLSNEGERQRSGGAGVYYHASYWGRPHDYLWLSTTHPSLIREEMMKAYQTGADRLWVLNVGDIKPLEYTMQFFLDMAYRALPFQESSYTQKHLLGWHKKIFGKEAQAVTDVMWSYYNLAFERRPEFMGWSQTEPTSKTTYTAYNHFYYGDEAQRRMDRYEGLEKAVVALRSRINSPDAAAFFELVYYPVVGAAEMNKKFLFRDKACFYAKQNRMSAYDYAALSNEAYRRIEKETEYFNTSLKNGKWKGIMSMKPRNLPVFDPPALPAIAIKKENSWGIAPEGVDTATVGHFVLPAFTEGVKQTYFIDVFLSDSTTIQWKAIPSADWIVVAAKSGTLTAEKNKNQKRVWVTVDWGKAPRREQMEGQIRFRTATKQYTVDVPAIRPPSAAWKNHTGFVEANGYVSIFAKHFTEKRNRGPFKWELTEGLGRTGASMMTAFSSLAEKAVDTAAIRQSASYLAYDFVTFSDASPQVVMITLPTLPLNKAYRMRYALCIDDEPLQILDATSNSTARTEEWKQNVLSNTAIRKVRMNFLKKGKHTLKVFAIDPGVVLSEIRIDLGGLKKGYSAIAETKK